MPVYEYYCPETHTVYCFYARSLREGEKVPRCPDPKGKTMIKQVSGFAITGKHGDEPGPGGGDPDDPRMERAMAEMEREFAGMDESNPDPRQLGALMRRMGELTGERLPPELEEAARRLEAGEDPDAVEETLGDLDECGVGDMPDGADTAPGGTLSRQWAKLRKGRNPLRRDPDLYELRDWL